MENPIKMDDLGVPLFLETPINPQVISGHFAAYQVLIQSFKRNDEMLTDGLVAMKLKQVP